MGAQAPRLANDRRLRHPPPMRLREKNVRPRVLRTGNYSTPVLSEICLPVEHLPAGIRWPAARLCRNVCTASSYFCRSRPPLPLTVLGTATMDLSTSQFNVGGKGECAGRMRKPLARIAGRLRSCGTQWPPTFFVWARSVRCVPHVCTSVLLHFTCYAPPPPPDPIIPDATYAVTMVKAFQKKGTYLMK